MNFRAPEYPRRTHIFTVAALIMASLRMFEESAHAAAYALFRPSYPRIVFDTISTFIRKNNGSGFQVAVDVACGSGQSTFSLCSRFQKVIGVDISDAQIKNARAKAAEALPVSKSVEFIVGDAHDLPLESSSADIITCATAWHWLDPELFYRETKRVLKPNGCLAVYGYTLGSHSVGNYHSQAFFTNFVDCLKEAGCWHERIKYCENKYADVKLPFALTERHEFLMPWETDLNNFIGYMSSMSSYRTYSKKYPDNTILEDHKKTYLDATGDKETNPKLKYFFTGFAIIGQNS